MNKANRDKISGSIYWMPDWWISRYNYRMPDPMISKPEELQEDLQWMNKKINECYPEIDFGESPYKYAEIMFDHFTIEQAIAIAYGAPEPLWDPTIQGYWHDRDNNVWDWVKTVDDVNRIKVPDWENEPVIQKILALYEKYKSAFPGKQIKRPHSYGFENVRNEITYNFKTYSTFVDLGPVLFGFERFWEILALEDELAEALMEKCFHIICSYSDFYHNKTEFKNLGVANVGGNYTCFFSPNLFRKYGKAFDLKLIEKYGGGGIPFNLHSCGQSIHLFEEWGFYNDVIDLMMLQTRAVKGHMNRLKKLLPDTRLEITITQPQFDFMSQDIKQVVWQYAEELEFDNGSIELIIPSHVSNFDEIICRFYEAIDEVNNV